MLMTRETDYALRILRALADGEQRSIEEISRAEAAPKQFAYKIIKKLQKAGWLAIARGAEGGCRLRADLNQVTLYDLTALMGTGGAVSPCLDGGYTCTRAAVCEEPCQARLGLHKVQKAIDAELRRHTLAELIFGE
ncbi:MAG: Rrf2 family transcriptional regulator [Clostridia bacterium]|nr:Rrf2 family transcriptional regulator [Clostridia bacterium]